MDHVNDDDIKPGAGGHDGNTGAGRELFSRTGEVSSGAQVDRCGRARGACHGLQSGFIADAQHAVRSIARLHAHENVTGGGNFCRDHQRCVGTAARRSKGLHRAGKGCGPRSVRGGRLPRDSVLVRIQSMRLYRIERDADCVGRFRGTQVELSLLKLRMLVQSIRQMNYRTTYKITEGRNETHHSVGCLFLDISSFCVAQRLPELAVPDNYKLTFAPDFAKNNFAGDETIQIQVLKPTSQIVLNAAEIDFQAVTITSAGRQPEGQVTLEKEKEMAIVTVGTPLQPGPATIQIRYTGILNERTTWILSRQGRRRPKVRGHAVRVYRCTTRISFVR